MYIIKRNGSKEEFNLEKWQNQIAKVCEGVKGVSPSMVELNSKAYFKDGMTTKELDEIALRAMVDLIDEQLHPEYGNVNYAQSAGKLLNSMMRKDVYKQYEPIRLYDTVKYIISKGLYTPELLEWYTEKEWDKLDSYMEHSKDEEYSYSALHQLKTKYLIQDRTTKQIFESPQVRYMVASATIFHSEKVDRLKQIKEYYEFSTAGLFTKSTPTLAGLGSKTKNVSSCVLIKTNDTLGSIFASGEMVAKYAAARAGIGLETGAIRAAGAKIRNGEIEHPGHLPYLKKFYADLSCASQGGIRKASATITYPLWHLQFEELIVLKNNQGTEETRVRFLDYSVVINDMFIERIKKRIPITLFDPSDVPDLYEAFYRDTKLFNTLYAKYEKAENIRKKQIPSRQLFYMLLKERKEVNRIYVLHIENVQNCGPFKTILTPIYQSNLCQEIMLPTVGFDSINDENGRIALCTLGSMNWGAFRNPEEMKRPAQVLVKALHLMLQDQSFVSIHSKLHNEEFEPLGIGVTNLAYWHAKRKFRYGDPEALAEVKRWMEHQYYYLLEASMNLAKEKGPCTRFKDTHYADGVFVWERRKDGVNELTDFTPSKDLDWEKLRQDILKYGMRNTTLCALPPVESCQKNTNKILTTDGLETIYDIAEKCNIDWKTIETKEIKRSINVENYGLTVKGPNNNTEKITHLVYNGLSSVNELTFEDGTVLSFTDNHRLLVERNGERLWLKICEIEEGDDVIETKDFGNTSIPS